MNPHTSMLIELEDWVQRRLEALEKMETKLREMRTLAEYATERALAPKEVMQVQEWMKRLHCEVVLLDQESLWRGSDDLTH